MSFLLNENENIPILGKTRHDSILIAIIFLLLSKGKVFLTQNVGKKRYHDYALFFV